MLIKQGYAWDSGKAAKESNTKSQIMISEEKSRGRILNLLAKMLLGCWGSSEGPGVFLDNGPYVRVWSLDRPVPPSHS